MIARVAAIARADAAIRLRRWSTVVTFLLLSACAYLWVPDPSTGRALIQIEGRRALYNSAALGMATAMLATLFVGLFGFYVISNAVRRDIDSRCGLLLASTPMRKSEYIAGKFAGNVAFLALFTSGFMVTSMAMQIVRGEAPLHPITFVLQYALLAPPAIVFVAATAVIFECTPFLSSRFGDVLYFFFWAGTLGSVAASLEHGASSVLVKAFDFTGMGFALDVMKRTVHTTSMSIGSSRFDVHQPPFVFQGLVLPPEWIAPRVLSLIMPIVAMAFVTLWFHRFDPARVRRAAGGFVRSRLSRVARALSAAGRPLSRMLMRLPSGGVASTDALLTFSLTPWPILVWIGVTIAAIVNPRSLPVALAATAVMVADVASRDRRAGTLALIRSAPHLRERFVGWKFASATIVAFAFMAVPIVRSPSPIAAAVATLFIALTATAAGVATNNPKTFIVLFLTFWYVVVNDRGTPALNFGGVHGAPAASVTAAYAAIAVAVAIAGQLLYGQRLRRGD